MIHPSRQKMCIINPALLPLIAPLVGKQIDIMVRVGISWNSWNKLLEGQPVRVSMAERFRSRIADMAAENPAFIAAYPAADGTLDRDALDAEFILPPAEHAAPQRAEAELLTA